MNSLPEVYAVILNYNGYIDTVNCIESLKKVNYKKLKLVVVDNASTDDSVQQLKKNFSDIKFIVSDENLGYAGGMNLGIKHALKNEGDLILLSNNDIEFTENFLEPLINIITSREEIGIVSPKILYLHDKDTIYFAGGEFRISLCGAFNPFQGKPSQYFGNRLRKISFVDGSCLLVKKRVFEKIGFLDEKYFMYFEDLDFSKKVGEYFEMNFVPESIVYHKTGAGLSWKDFSPLYYYYSTRNRLIFFSNFNFWIKVYTLIFTTINSIAKSLVLLKTYLFQGKKAIREKSLQYLWQGYYAGLKFFLGIKKLKKKVINL